MSTHRALQVATLVLVAALVSPTHSPVSARTEKLIPGSVCILPLPTNAREIDHEFPDGKARREFEYKFSIQFDSDDPVPVPATESVLVDDLDRLDKHLIVIRDGEQIIESFWFTFRERGSFHLCLRYQPWYQTWSLDPAPPGEKRCILKKRSK